MEQPISVSMLQVVSDIGHNILVYLGALRRLQALYDVLSASDMDLGDHLEVSRRGIGLKLYFS